MTSNNPNRTAAGGQLRDYDELQGTLLPTASLAVEPSAPLEVELLPTARPVHESQQREAAAAAIPEEAPLIPPVPTDERYKREGEDTLARAAREGRRASEAERMRVLRNNRTIPAYNNQAELDVDRANQVARLENYREHQLVTPPLPAPPLETSSMVKPSAAKEEGDEYYFSSGKKGGYEVKEYKMDEYDGGYSYDIAEYKSDYD